MPGNTTEGKDVPIILCFHGAGTNGAIFQLQARKIVQSLRSHFRFLFLDAPFDSLPGPGVATIFKDLKPFFRWHCDRTAIENFDIEPKEVERERMRTRRSVQEAINNYGRENIVGVMGFSQGTRVATAVCLDESLGLGIAFAIMIAGTFPILPLALEVQEIATNRQSLAPTTVLDERLETNRPGLRIPSIHIQGVRDPWQPDSMRLLQAYYDVDQAVIIRFNGAHQVPTLQRDADQIRDAVLRAWSGVVKRVGGSPLLCGGIGLDAEGISIQKYA